MSTTTLNSIILNVTRRTTKGFTVGEIYDRVLTHIGNSINLTNIPPYNSVRARVYELNTAGKLVANDTRKDTISGRQATTFIHSFG